MTDPKPWGDRLDQLLRQFFDDTQKLGVMPIILLTRGNNIGLGEALEILETCVVHKFDDESLVGHLLAAEGSKLIVQTRQTEGDATNGNKTAGTC